MTNKTLLIPAISALALAAAGVLPATAAATEVKVGDVLGTSVEDVRAALASRGYTVTEIEREDDEIEAEVKQAGVELEIEIDPATGAITEIEQDD